MYQRFKNRREAGILLARKLSMYAGRSDAVVLALPRGGVPVAYEVAKALNLPLDVFVVRKLGAPGHEEFALGSIASGGVCLVDETSVKALHVPETELNEIIQREQNELERRERLYRGARPKLDVHRKTVIIVDDGLATGLTMRAAVAAIRKLHPKEIVVAVPVCAPVTCVELEHDVDVWCVCAESPEAFYAVGLWYENFDQTSDQEVQTLLARADAGRVAARHYV
ncbi:MAG TPA: phosphoribosyltransferase [Pyrinomonadaceae bacterium]